MELRRAGADWSMRRSRDAGRRVQYVEADFAATERRRWKDESREFSLNRRLLFILPQSWQRRLNARVFR